MKLYRESIIWRRNSETSWIRFLCFEDLEAKRFLVCSADSDYLPLMDTENNRLWLSEIEKADCFLHLDSYDQASWAASVSEAISQFEKSPLRPF
jgi:hypothetical protein